VNIVRFSSIFQLTAVPPQAAAPVPEAAPEIPAAETPVRLPAPELPDDLDARVRLVGEWQLGEAC
jgi:hypothetical protein